MTKGLQRSLGRAPLQDSDVSLRSLKMTVPFTAKNITINGATGVGFGSVVLANFPEGNIQFEGAVVNVSFLEADAGIIDTWSGDFSIGTTPASDGTLSAGDVDLIASTALGAASGGAVATTRVASLVAVAGTIHDNTANTLEVNFNMLIDDASISANGTIMTITGELVLTYNVLGDD